MDILLSVHQAYQPPDNNTSLSDQISHQLPILFTQKHQPPVKEQDLSSRM
jgi:hypothetical protein